MVRSGGDQRRNYCPLLPGLVVPLTLLGKLLTAFQNKTPLIVTAGQQTREMLLLEPWLTNVEATTLPRPWVKWAYEPVRAQDVPAAIMRGIAIAVQPPAGPVFLSLPLDDWDQPCAGPAVVRTVATRTAPDPARLREFAEVIRQASHPVLIYGAAIAGGSGWTEAVAFAEALNALVWAAPSSERAPFPENHPLYVGGLPFAMGPLSDQLQGHDVAVAIAPVFRYYPYVAGPGTCRPACGCCTFPKTPPRLAACRSVTAWWATRCCPWPGSPTCSPVTHRPRQSRTRHWSIGWRRTRRWRRTGLRMACCPPRKCSRRSTRSGRITPSWSRRAPRICPTCIRHGRSPSQTRSTPLPAEGWAGTFPASVGIALAERELGRDRPVIVVIGDGSFQYSVQSIWTAARLGLSMLVVIMRNDEYAILKAFARLEQTPGVPGLDLPSLDIVSIVSGYGCDAALVADVDALKQAVAAAWTKNVPTVLEVRISAQIPALV